MVAISFELCSILLSKSLVRLSMARTKMSYQDLQQFLIANLRSREIYIVGKSIDDEGAVFISKFVKIAPALVTLVLSNNDIGDIGANAIGEAIGENPVLRSLSLSCNKISLKGVEGLANGLKTNTKLESINLCDNDVGDEGAICMSRVLEESRTLVSVFLQNNSITHRGRADQAICDAMRDNYIVTALSVTGKAYPEVTEYIERNKALVRKIAEKIYVNESGEFEISNLSLSSLSYLKCCNKTLLVTTLIGRQLFTREDEISIDEKFVDFLNRYLDEQFYRSNFFELAGVCKKLAYSEEVNEGFAVPIGIYSLPKPLQLMLVDPNYA